MSKPAVIVLTDDGEIIADDRAGGTKYIRKDRIRALEREIDKKAEWNMRYFEQIQDMEQELAEVREELEKEKAATTFWMLEAQRMERENQ